MPERDVSGGFRDVDQGGGARPFIDYLDSMGQQLAPLKRLVLEALRLDPGDHVLDVGSGTGDDLSELARMVGGAGRVVGLDSSQELVEEARRRNETVEVHRGDAHQMDFSDGTFDKVRAERILMHVDDPASVIGEIKRVLRAGGRVVLAEPDWDTLVLDSDDLDTARRAARLVARGGRQPDIGRRLARLATAHGLEVLSVDCISSVMRDCAATEEIVRIEGAIEREDDDVVGAWWRDLRSSQEDFLAVLTFVVVAASKR